MQGVHNEQSDRFCHAGADDNTDTQKAGKNIGGASAFDEAEYHAPHATQWQTVEEHGEDIIRSGQESEENQGEFRYQNGSQDELHAVLLL